MTSRLRRRPFLLGLVSLAACSESAKPDDTRVSALSALSPSGQTPDKLWFGITPSAGKDTAARLSPMNAFVGRRLGLPIEGKTAKGYDDVIHMLNDGEVHMGIISPATYVRAHRKRLEAVTIATATRRGSPTYLGCFVARRTNDGTAPPLLGSFRGRRVAWVSEASTSGYIYPRDMLRGRGLDPDTFFSESFFTGNHQAAVEAVAEGRADVAAVASPFVDPDAGRDVPGADQLVVIAKTRRIPLDCVVVHKSVERSLAERLQKALFALSNDIDTSRALSDSWGLSGFVRPMTQRYEEVADVLDRA